MNICMYTGLEVGRFASPNVNRFDQVIRNIFGSLRNQFKPITNHLRMNSLTIFFGLQPFF